MAIKQPGDAGYGIGPKPFSLGDIDDEWIDDLHRRMLLCLEREIAALERVDPTMPDPIAAFRAKLDLLERFLKVQRLAKTVWPRRQSAARSKRRHNSVQH